MLGWFVPETGFHNVEPPLQSAASNRVGLHGLQMASANIEEALARYDGVWFVYASIILETCFSQPARSTLHI